MKIIYSSSNEVNKFVSYTSAHLICLFLLSQSQDAPARVHQAPRLPDPRPRPAHRRDPYLSGRHPSPCPSRVGLFAELAEGQPDMSSSVGGGSAGGGGVDMVSLLEKAKDLDQLKKEQDEIVADINKIHKKLLACKLL